MVTHVLVNSLGGITSMEDNVIRYRGPNALPQKAIFLDVREKTASGSEGVFGGGIPVSHFSFSQKENWYSIYNRLARLVDTEEGVLVMNDVYEMIMLTHFNIRKKTVQLVHDAYNVRLAVQYGDVADAFICHSRFYYEVMLQLFPGRRKDIFHIPYGIPVPPGVPERITTPKIRLVFLGRHDRMKGIFDLVEIEKILAAQGISTDWLILGRGPETAALKEQWNAFPNVTFLSPESNAEVLQKLGERDVLVFPTKFEGFPVALLEAMGTGCVPVASELPGGLRELIRNGVNGYLCEMDNNVAFAEKIALLYRDRDLLSSLSRNARADVVAGYNVLLQSPKYQDLFKTLAGSKGNPVHHGVKKKLGSRLDQPWLPNSIVKILRKTR